MVNGIPVALHRFYTCDLVVNLSPVSPPCPITPPPKVPAMASTVPLPLDCAPTLHAEFAYLLMGDLRLLLDDPSDLQTSRWLLAVLDRLLAIRVPLEAILAMRHSLGTDWRDINALDAPFYAKLQRLRDRVAHRKPYVVLANDVRCELHELLAPA